MKTTSGIDSFHRRLLRSACLNIKWPQTISNDELYATTEAEPWSRRIRRRQLSWFGHMVRLPDDTPAKKSFAYAQRPEAKPRGRQIITWLTMMKATSLDTE